LLSQGEFLAYVKGNPDRVGAAPVLEISGSAQGHGVLIVEDAALWIRGDFLWHGLIVVTGHRVAMGVSGGGNQTVLGSVILNDTSGRAGAERGFVTGNARLHYSCTALDQARRARKLVIVRSWSEVVQ